MATQDKGDGLFDGMLTAAISDAFTKEMDDLPGEEALESYKPSPALDQRIGAMIKKHRGRTRAKHFFKSVGKIAAVLCILITVSSIILMSVGATRNAILNAIIQWQEKYTEIQFNDPAEQKNLYKPAYLPEGFRESTVRILGNSTMVIYENKEGKQIYFYQGTAENDNTFVDNENTDPFEVKISGNTAYLFKAKTENDSNMLIWQGNGIVFKLTSTMDSEELIKIGESLKKS